MTFYRNYNTYPLSGRQHIVNKRGVQDVSWIIIFFTLKVNDYIMIPANLML